MAGTQRRWVPSPHARSRLKWTGQLHERFVEAVSLLGGANKATPKSVKRAMSVPGLTLYHVKSHLQKYRLAVKRIPEASCNSREEDIMADDCSAEESPSAHVDMARNQTHIDESTLQMHLEVERKLNEQIEVQRHLHLRIEAQGRYLQSALRKAQEMLATYGLDSAAMEAAESELSELVSAVDTECLSSSCSGGNPAWPRRADCSGDSCLTSWEMPEVMDERLCKQETGLLHHNSSEDADDISSDVGKPVENLVGNESGVGNKVCSIFCEENCVQGQPGCPSNGHSPQRKLCCHRASEEIDLNRAYVA